MPRQKRLKIALAEKNLPSDFAKSDAPGCYVPVEASQAHAKECCGLLPGECDGLNHVRK